MIIANNMDRNLRRLHSQLRQQWGTHEGSWWRSSILVRAVIVVLVTAVAAWWFDYRDQPWNARPMPDPVVAAVKVQVAVDVEPPYKIVGFDRFHPPTYPGLPSLDGYVFVGDIGTGGTMWGLAVFERFDVYERKVRAALPAAPVASRPAFDVEKESGK